MAEGWTQPLCGTCWIAYDLGRGVAEERLYIGAPTRVREAEIVPCAVCGQPTDLGIYVRISPQIVKEIREARDGV